MSYLVSILMTVHNGDPYIRDAIASVIAQTLREFELIVVDNGSTDGSLDTVRSFSDPRIKLRSLGRNIGRTPALNVALEAARGRYIAILDADDIAYPARLRAQTAYLGFHPEVALVAGGVDWFSLERGIVQFYQSPITDVEIAWRLVFWSAFAHSSVMMRRDVVQSVGGYDETFEYASDFGLYSMMMRKGYRFACLPDKVCAIRLSSGSASRTFGDVTRIEPAVVSLQNLDYFLPELSSRELKGVQALLYEEREGDSEEEVEISINSLARICETVSARSPVNMRGLRNVRADAARRIASIGWNNRSVFPRAASLADRQIHCLAEGPGRRWVYQSLSEACLGLALRAGLRGDKRRFRAHLRSWMHFAIRSGVAIISGRREDALLLFENAKMALGHGWWLTTLTCGVLAFGLRPVRALKKGMVSLLLVRGG